MGLEVRLYALGMLLTGTIITIATKYQDRVVVGYKDDGTPILFQHPGYQTWIMFLGEAGCLFVYFFGKLWDRLQRRRTQLSSGVNADQARPLLGNLRTPLLDSNVAVDVDAMEAESQLAIHIPGKREGGEEFEKRDSTFLHKFLVFGVATFLDIMATTLMNIGLLFTTASAWQMLRGTLCIFTGMWTVIVLRRPLRSFHWTGILFVAIGAAVVGATSIFGPQEQQPSAASSWVSSLQILAGASSLGGIASNNTIVSSVSSNSGRSVWNDLMLAFGAVGKHKNADPALLALIGSGMVVAAQAIQALQFIWEEMQMKSLKIEVSLAVGIEGIWGVLLSSILLAVAYFLRGSDAGSLENFPLTMQQVFADRGLFISSIGSIVALIFFNFFGNSVTALLSGGARATVDSCRTLFIWGFALVAGWETFKILELVGFTILLTGSLLYNELLPGFRYSAPLDLVYEAVEVHPRASAASTRSDAPS